MPGEHSLFTIRGSLKKRIVTATIFAFFILMGFAGIYLRNIYIFVMSIGASLLSFWPLADAYERIEVTSLRIRRSEFSKKTAKTEDIPLDSLALCTTRRLNSIKGRERTPEEEKILFNMLGVESRQADNFSEDSWGNSVAV